MTGGVNLQRIIKYELFKIVSNKVLIITAALFIAFSLYSDISFYRDDPNNFGNLDEFYSEFYNGNEGTVSLNDFEKAQTELQNEQKGIKPSENIVEASRTSHYANDVSMSYYGQKDFQKELLKEKELAKEKLKKYGENSYEYREEKLHYDMMVNEPLPGVYFTIPWQSSSGGAFAAAILIILAVSPVFSSEYSNKTDSLILTSKKGRYTVAAAKIISCVIFSASLAFFFSLFFFVSSVLMHGVKGYNAPIQELYFSSLYCCFNLTVLQFFFIKILFSVIGCIAISLITVFLSSIFKNSVIPFFIVSALLGGPFVLERVINVSKLHGLFKYIYMKVSNFNYINLLDANSFYGSFKAYNIFGFPVLSYLVIPSFFIIVTIIFVILTHKCFENHKVN